MKHFKSQLTMKFEQNNSEVPFMVAHLDEHKLRVEYSESNEMVYPKGKKYPKNRWYTVIAANAVNPMDDLNNQLKKLARQGSYTIARQSLDEFCYTNW